MQTTNGNANGHCNGTQEVLQWKVGLINSSLKYLTAETFGHKVNASATGLKKKQTWILEQDPNEEVVYIKSHLGCYMSTDHYGNITCDTEGDERTDEHKFIVEYDRNGSGRWAFKNKVHNNYLGGSDDNVKCVSKPFTDTELWTVQLAIQPMVNLRNVIRKRFAVSCNNELQCKEIIPWGEAGLIILHFWPKNGKYSLKTCDGKFLHRDGNLVECQDDNLEDDAKFTLEIRSGVNSGLAFKDSEGYYLTAIGSTATMKSGKNKGVGKDELFTLECSNPQVTICSQNNGKLISAKQGVDLSANQSELCEKSTFQMELDKHSKKWAFRTSVDNKYWSLESFGGIQAASLSKGPKTLFEVESNGDGTVCIKASNSKCLYNKQTGSILANMDTPESKHFIIRMVNRPFLILKCDFGFVALKSESQKPEIVCNKTSYEPTFMESQEDGYYYLKGKNNKYWTVHADKSIHADSDTPTCKFLLEFYDQSQLTIKTVPEGVLLKGEQNSFMAKGEEGDPNTVWEY